MAIAMEFFNIIIPKTVIAANYPGGVDRCMKDGGPGTLEDEYLIRGGAMSWYDMERIIRYFEQFGIRYLDERGKAVDMVVVDMLRGPMTPCDWIEFDSGKDGPRCWLHGTPPGALSKPNRPADYNDTIVVFRQESQGLTPIAVLRRDDSGAIIKDNRTVKRVSHANGKLFP
jgi:hypothetical protein